MAAILLVVLPVWALNQSGNVRLAGQIVLTFVLGVVAGGTGVFGCICINAKAKKWGVGLILITLVSLLGIYWVWTGTLPLLA